MASKTAVESTGMIEIPFKDLIIDPKKNGRVIMDKAEIEKLADDMKRNGQMTPVTCRHNSKKQAELTAGYRRCAAAILLGWTSIKAVFREEDEKGAAMTNARENIIREDLSDYEMAQTFAGWKKNHGMIAKDIAREMAGKRGMSVGYINNLVRTYESLHPDLLKAWLEDRIAAKQPEGKGETAKGYRGNKIPFGSLLKLAGISKEEQLAEFKKKNTTSEDGAADEENRCDQRNAEDKQCKLDDGHEGAHEYAGAAAKRPSQTALSVMIDSVEGAAKAGVKVHKDLGYLDGLKHALEFASGTRKTLPHVTNNRGVPVYAKDGSEREDEDADE